MDGKKSQANGSKDAAAEAGHVFTGIPGLDKMLGKGIPVGSSVLIEGGPGSGKTMLCLAIASHYCKTGKKVLYMSFEEPEKRLVEHLETLDKNAKKYISSDLLRLKRFNALDVARSVEALLSEAKKELLIDVNPVFFPTDFKPDLVLMDSLTSISSAFSGEDSRFRIYMEQLFRYLEKENISSFLIREVANPSHTGRQGSELGEAVSFLSDGIIIIYNVLHPGGERGTGIEILKLRGVAIERKIVKMKIGMDGITVYPNEQIPSGCTLT
ncbi:MAG: AAA family ATPase [Candidatus Micrarchaeota archaeon]|nr:AAA family ATPase [Candidatus Micrarchaeota archaeon]